MRVRRPVMMLLSAVLLLCLNLQARGRGLLEQSASLHGAGPAGVGEEQAIRAVLSMQESAWNRGDLTSFATGYKRSADILFIGAKVSRGYDAMVTRYREAYPTPETMGQLHFTEVAVQPLDARFATVTGRFHLKRTAAGGGDAAGTWMLVFEKTAEGWKIVRDVTVTDQKQ